MKSSVIIVAAAVIAGSFCVPVLAQTGKQPTKTWRTPWGDPDLGGSWSNATTTPLQRPGKYGNREFLTREERSQQDKDTSIGTDRRTEAGTPDDVNGAYNQFWWERGWSDGRTSLIYDPPDGRIPPLTPEAQKRIAAQPKPIPLEARADVLDKAAYNGPEDVE